MSRKLDRHEIQLLILLFADDVALLSTTPTGLQKQLGCLKTCCQDITELEVQKAIKNSKCGKACGLDGITAEFLWKWRTKQKPWYSQRVEFLAKHEKWFYNDARLEVVNKYCYLGFNFTNHSAAKGKNRSNIS